MSLWESGDRIDILWSGGVLSGVYADHRNGGRVIAKTPHNGPEIYEIGEFGRCSIRAGIGASWGTPLDQHWEALHAKGDVDDTTECDCPPTPSGDHAELCRQSGTMSDDSERGT